MKKPETNKRNGRTRQTYVTENLRNVQVKWALSPNAKARANNINQIAKLIRKANIGLADLINSELMRHYTFNVIKDYYLTAQQSILSSSLEEGGIN